MAFEGFPFFLGWELTLNCNLKCNHCGSSAGLPRNNELTLNESLSLCNQLPELLVQEVNFTGGEPLLNPNWETICLHLKDLGIKTKIITNGLTIDLQTIQKMKNAGIIGVGVSIDGLEKTHDKIRNKKGIFEIAINRIKLLLNNNLPVTIITSVNNYNINELPIMVSLLKSYNISQWQIQPVLPQGRAIENDEFKLSFYNYCKLGKFISNYIDDIKEDGLRIIPADSIGYFTDMDKNNLPWKGCNAGLLTCGITSDGKVKGCLSMSDLFIEGDLRKNSLWDIWFHKDSFKFNRDCTPNDLGINCNYCKYGQICKGGCSSMSYASSGILHNDPYCFYSIRKMLEDEK